MCNLGWGFRIWSRNLNRTSTAKVMKQSHSPTDAQSSCSRHLNVCAVARVSVINQPFLCRRASDSFDGSGMRSNKSRRLEYMRCVTFLQCRSNPRPSAKVRSIEATCSSAVPSLAMIADDNATFVYQWMSAIRTMLLPNVTPLRDVSSLLCSSISLHPAIWDAPKVFVWTARTERHCRKSRSPGSSFTIS